MSSSRDISPEQRETLRAEKAKDEELARLDRDEDLKWLMSHRRGRNIMNRLLDVTGVYRSSFTGNSETFFREGGRNIGLIFLADLQALAPEGYLEMLKEHRPVKPDNASGSRSQ